MNKKINLKDNISAPDLIDEADLILKDLEVLTKRAERTLANYVIPVRQSIIRRFPVLFMLLVSLGASATFLGLEKMITRYDLLNNSPELILLLGITILIFTGRLYKKLG